ncbi:uncharacterized protein EI90DRAFT_3138011 [Cantharellus anzutake]|uniref:uncharacterized protein n=1 Tax=Cantharellus anzutake TaxID=1750568 RepID=UPI00190851A2|nr:uncharacterized protein EI90DRAFT_3138011 [Cantharellus anzutake]KAF8311788.1 hypothetical protein EI90DRAFT_3138011 [Cantharellus anzutake]
MSDMTPYTSGWKALKKSELIGLADKLGIPADTASLKKPEIIGSIQRFLDENEGTLSEIPKFKALYPRRVSSNRRGSLIPNQTEESSETPDPPAPVAPASRRGAGKFPPRASSSTESAEGSKAVAHALSTPSRIPLPPSPIKLIQDFSAKVRPEIDAVVANAARAKDQLGIETSRILAKTKMFLSDSANLTSITVLWELFFLVMAFTPVEYTPFQLPPSISKVPYTVNVPHPPMTLIYWETLFILLAKWSLPTLIIPQATGKLVAFSDRRDIDPLTSSIARLVCVLSLPWVVAEELLSLNTRILAASTALAFAVAEALNDRKDRAEIASSLVKHG